VVKVFWHDAISQPHTGRSNRIRQVAPMCTTSSTSQSASAPYWRCPLLSRFGYIDHRTCPGLSWPSPFHPQNCRFASGDLDPSSIWFIGSTCVHIPNPNAISIGSLGSTAFAGLTVVTDRQTDKQTTLFRLYNRPHLATAVMRPNNEMNEKATSYNQTNKQGSP